MKLLQQMLSNLTLWNVTLTDGSVLDVHAHSHRDDGHHITFLVITGTAPGDTSEILRLPSQAVRDVSRAPTP